MTRQLEAVAERRQAKRYALIVAAIEFDIEDSLSQSGAEVTGLAIKWRGSDCLVIVKAILAGRQQVAFIGGEDLGSALIKLVREAQADKLRWRADRYGGESEVVE